MSPKNPITDISPPVDLRPRKMFLPEVGEDCINMDGVIAVMKVTDTPEAKAMGVTLHDLPHPIRRHGAAECGGGCAAVGGRARAVSTYPDDIMEAARAVYDRLGRGSVADERTIAEALQGQRFAATYAERQRCRRVARNALLSMRPQDRANGDLCDEALTAAIRKDEEA